MFSRKAIYSRIYVKLDVDLKTSSLKLSIGGFLYKNVVNILIKSYITLTLTCLFPRVKGYLRH